MAKLIAKVYGDALFEAALDKQNLEAVYEEAQALCSIFRDNPKLMDALNHPQIVKEEKISVMENVFSGRVSDEMMGFLTIIVDKGRQKEIPMILDYFIQAVREYKKIGTAFVASAVALRDEQKAAVKAKLLETTPYVEFEMEYTVDPGLIGGMVIRIGDRVVDSSIKTQLYELKKQLLTVRLA